MLCAVSGVVSASGEGSIAVRLTVVAGVAEAMKRVAYCPAYHFTYYLATDGAA